ncbi:MAG: ATPase central domain protein [Pseudonocardiales bacterium]|nr:ATPase central domain protein [Pseudonocardiales bacterium]
MADSRLQLIDAIAAAAERRRKTPSEDGGHGADQLASCVEILRADHAAADPRVLLVESAALRRIEETFGLDDTDRAIVFACAMAELDGTVSLAYALLRGLVPGAARCTVALAMELSGAASAAEGLHRLGYRQPLRNHDLVDLSSAEPWMERTIRIPDSVVRVIAGLAPADPVVDAMRVDVQPLDVPGAARLANALRDGGRMFWVRARPGAPGASLAAGAMQAAGIPGLTVDLRMRPGGVTVEDAVAVAVREAGLSDRALIVSGADELGDGPHGAFDRLRDPVVPVVLVGSRPWKSAWLPELPLTVEAAPLSVVERRELWVASAGADIDDETLDGLCALRLGPEDVAAAIRFAGVLAGAGNEPVSGTLLRTAARRVGGSGAVSGGRIITTASHGAVGFGDVIVPAATEAELRRIVSWAKNRDVVARRGLYAERGRGITALFAGSSGTGKTLAARVLADQLSMDLFQVDLSAVVDKYIGETEKNLEKVFQAAEALDVVLFFDEADALFGSRSEVKDARDRYANQEVAYLLQRMEEFDGITVLASNLRGNLDKAFSRRLTFIVPFPEPDSATRQRLWQYHLAQLDGLSDEDPIDVAVLAGALEMAGGDIRNIVLAAAYDAADEQLPVGMRHVVAAALRETRKLGRIAPEKLLAAYL